MDSRCGSRGEREETSSPNLGSFLPLLVSAIVVSGARTRTQDTESAPLSSRRPPPSIPVFHLNVYPMHRPLSLCQPGRRRPSLASLCEDRTRAFHPLFLLSPTSAHSRAFSTLFPLVPGHGL